MFHYFQAPHLSPRTARQAFSLVELSIVLVILGLLVGGILTGQSLIRAAELRAVTMEYQKYVAAVQTFRDKYFAIPGDMANAESFWGTFNADNTLCLNGISTTAATCNGGGDGNVQTFSSGGSVAGTSRSREIFRFWQHLANAGLIEGQYSGTWNGTDNWGAIFGTNMPKSKFGNAGWGITSKADVTAIGGFYAAIFQPSSGPNWLQFGNLSISSWPLSPTLKNEEAWNIDTKLDDGRPGTGNVTTMNNSYGTSCASSDTAATATYQLTQTADACSLIFGM